MLIINNRSDDTLKYNLQRTISRGMRQNITDDSHCFLWQYFRAELTGGLRWVLDDNLCAYLERASDD